MRKLIVPALLIAAVLHNEVLSLAILTLLLTLAVGKLLAAAGERW